MNKREEDLLDHIKKCDYCYKFGSEGCPDFIWYKEIGRE